MKVERVRGIEALRVDSLNYESDRELDGRYILVKAEEPKETVQLSHGTRPGWLSIPIINLREKPGFIDII